MSSPGKIIVLLAALLFVCSCRPSRDEYFASGEKFVASHQYSEASIQFRNALKIDKNHVPSHLALARVYEQTGDPRSAIAEFRQVLNIDDKNIEARLKIGRYQLTGGAGDPTLYSQAAQIASQILQQDPSNLEARILLGNAYSGMGEFEHSVEELTKALAQDPTNLHAALGLGAALLHNDTVKAEKTFREAADRHPDQIEAQLALAAYLASSNRTDGAELYFKKAFELDPADPKCLYPFAALYISIHRAGDAENLYREAISRRPKAREPRWELSQFYAQRGSGDKAIDVLHDLAKLFPDDRPVQLSLARLYLNRKDVDSAEKIARSLLSRKNNDPESHLLMGSIFSSRKEPDKALEEFNSAIQLGESSQEVYIEKAGILLDRGDLEGARKTLNSALEHSKSYVLSRGFLAKVLALQRHPEEALKEAQSVLAVMPKNEDAIVAKGDALRDLGRLKESRVEFQELVVMRPNYPFYLQRLGQVEASLGATQEALLHLRKAVEVKPDIPNGFREIVSAYLKAKQYDAAMAELARLSGLPSASQEEISRLRGQIFLEKNDLSSAEAEFRNIIAVNPKNYQAYIQIAQINLVRNNLPEAIREVDRLISANNKSAAGFFLKGYYLEASRDIPGAMANYKLALALEPENPLFNNNYAWLLCQNDSGLNEALSLATKAKRSQPDDPEVADTLGWIYYKKKLYGLAVEQLAFSVKNRPTADAEHYYRLGMAYFAKGDLQNAKVTLRKALALNPSFPGADDARRILQAPG